MHTEMSEEGITCRGSWVLGNQCGSCSRCKSEYNRLVSEGYTTDLGGKKMSKPKSIAEQVKANYLLTHHRLGYAVVRQVGAGVEYVGTDSASGGYPYWSPNFTLCRDRGHAISQRQSIGELERTKGVTHIVEIFAGFRMVEVQEVDKQVRDAALAKLTPSERRALGLE